MRDLRFLPLTMPLLAAPLLASPAHASDAIFSLGLQLAFELADQPGASIGLDLRVASTLGDECCWRNEGAIGGLVGFSYIVKGGVRLMVGIDYAEDAGELGSGGQLTWFYRSRGHLGPDTHGLALGAFVRTETALEFGANAFLSLDRFEPSMNTWFALRVSNLLFHYSEGIEGRPLHVDGQLAHVPSFVAPRHRPPAPDPELAAHWRRAAQAERASVSTFVELARDLASVGAPDSLIRAARRAARDEHHHAALSERIAARHGPAFFTQAPALPQRRPETHAQRLHRLAHEALSDGLLNESVATKDAEVAAQTCRHTDTRDVLRTVARDERQHADLAGATLAFALDRMPSLRDSLAETLSRVTAPTTTRPAHKDGVLDNDTHLAIAHETTAAVRARVHMAL